MTPGPWVTDGMCVRTTAGLLVARCTSVPDRSINSAKENARLIAAAPEMYKLLEYFADGGMNDTAASKDVRSLLARIDGTKP